MRASTPCEKATPFAVSAARVAISPFARGRDRSADEARQLVERTLRRWKLGESVGFTYVASLKSMGLIQRANGRYRLGAKYCGVQ